MVISCPYGWTPGGLNQEMEVKRPGEEVVRDPPRNNMEVVGVTCMSLNLLIVTVGS